MNMHEMCATGSKATNKQSNKNVNIKFSAHDAFLE